MQTAFISSTVKRLSSAIFCALAFLNLTAIPVTAEPLILRCVYIYDDLRGCDDLTTCPPKVGVVALGFDNATTDPLELIGVDTPADKGFMDQIYRFVDRSRERIIPGWPSQGAGNRLKFKNPDTGEMETYSTSYLCEAHKK